MHTKIIGNGYMAIKIDLEKSYDRLSWDFIRDTLFEVGLSDSWIRNILACVTTSSMTIAENSHSSYRIIPGRGIRQGDPISSYLFVLCVERLGHIISQSIIQGDWKPISLSQNGPAVSHFFFADDMVLFAEASEQKIHYILFCLDRFCQGSGQHVNFAKSNIYFSKNVPQESVDSLALLSGMAITSNMGKYLGMPSIHGRNSMSSYQYVLDRVSDRLTGWKMKCLSLAGRITSAISVLTSMLVHVMQTTWLTKELCHSLDRLIRHFIWGGTTNKHSVNLINWDTVTAPVRLGGLGICRMSVMNQAFMAKVGWRILNAPNSLWVNLVFAKYKRNHTELSRMVSKHASSALWRGIVAASPTLKAGIRRVVNNGWSTYFWRDTWVGSKPLIELSLSPHSLTDSYKLVSSYWEPYQGWKWEQFLGLLPLSVRQRLWASMVRIGDQHHDLNCWGMTSSGSFTVASAYELVVGQHAVADDNQWQIIWKLQVQPRFESLSLATLASEDHEQFIENEKALYR